MKTVKKLLFSNYKLFGKLFVILIMLIGIVSYSVTLPLIPASIEKFIIFSLVIAGITFLLFPEN